MQEDEESDIDILAITNETKKEINSGKYAVSLSPIEHLRNTVLIQPELVLPRVIEARAILNSKLLEEFKIKPTKKLFKKFYEETKEIIKIAKDFIEIDKDKGEELVSHSAIYSLILRARGLYLVRTLIEEKKYKKKEFERWILKEIKKEEFEKMYKIYRLEKEEKSSKEIKVLIGGGERLLNFLKKELEYLK